MLAYILIQKRVVKSIDTESLHCCTISVIADLSEEKVSVGTETGFNHRKRLYNGRFLSKTKEVHDWSKK